LSNINKKKSYSEYTFNRSEQQMCAHTATANVSLINVRKNLIIHTNFQQTQLLKYLDYGFIKQLINMHMVCD